MFSTVKTALVLVLACSALTACSGASGAAPANAHSSDAFGSQDRSSRRDVADAPRGSAR